MSGMKRTVEQMDPDYEEISVVHTNKRHKVVEHSGRNFKFLKLLKGNLDLNGVYPNVCPVIYTVFSWAQ